MMKPSGIGQWLGVVLVGCFAGFLVFRIVQLEIAGATDIQWGYLLCTY